MTDMKVCVHVFSAILVPTAAVHAKLLVSAAYLKQLRQAAYPTRLPPSEGCQDGQPTLSIFSLRACATALCPSSSASASCLSRAISSELSTPAGCRIRSKSRLKKDVIL
ncbi:MAG: hypothetical protein FRX49_09051 [Trebouxia sp. A1-2]|nr:MAG: hypothetical protein FRX49_09051 [Trebouxia sp. A1-2]